MKVTLVLNPKAAQHPELREMVHALRAHHDIRVRVSWESGDVMRHAKEAMDDMHDAVIVAGGDGSIHEALQVQYARTKSGHHASSLGALHYGTGNDFMRTLYTERVLEVEPQRFLEALLKEPSQVIDVDVGCANDTPFMNAISFGFGATTTENTPRVVKDFLGRSAYALWGVATLGNMEAFHFSLEHDGGRIEREAWQIVIGNGQFVGGGFRACPEASLRDGLLDVVVVPKMGAFETARAAQMLLNKAQHLEHEDVIALKVARASLKLNCELSVNADGEMSKEDHLDLSVTPMASRWLLPG